MTTNSVNLWQIQCLHIVKRQLVFSLPVRFIACVTSKLSWPQHATVVLSQKWSVTTLEHLLNGTKLFDMSPQNEKEYYENHFLFHIIKKLTWVCISKYEHLSSLLCCANWALNSAASLMALFIWLATFLFSNAFWKYRIYCTFELSQNLRN